MEIPTACQYMSRFWDEHGNPLLKMIVGESFVTGFLWVVILLWEAPNSTADTLTKLKVGRQTY